MDTGLRHVYDPLLGAGNKTSQSNRKSMQPIYRDRDLKFSDDNECIIGVLEIRWVLIIKNAFSNVYPTNKINLFKKHLN